jgi:hypothetical protein
MRIIIQKGKKELFETSLKKINIWSVDSKYGVSG